MTFQVAGREHRGEIKSLDQGRLLVLRQLGFAATDLSGRGKFILQRVSDLIDQLVEKPSPG